MSTVRAILSCLIFVASAALIVAVTHNPINAICPLIGGALGVLMWKRIQPEVAEIRSSPKASKKPAG